MSSLLSTRQSVDQAELASALRSALRGEVIARGHPEYDQARRVWNGLIDRHPAVIARCADTADVVETVRIAARRKPRVSIRGGGHQIAGSGVCDDGLVIDLGAMKQITVDAPCRRVRAQGGVTWGELDRVTQSYGLATPGGEVSTTGIAGFTLGGGMGLMMRRYGLSCDNLRAAELVTSDGEVRNASAEENPDLFWALRGGGRGLGVVTWFEYELHPLGPEVAAVNLFYPYDEATRILRAWPEVALAAPEAISPELALWSIPPDPAIPAELYGRKCVIVQGLYAGPAEEGLAALTPLRELATPLLEVGGLTRYTDLQSSLDYVFPTGGRYYMKSHFLHDLTEEAIGTILDWDARRPTPQTLMVLRTLGGAVSRVGPETSSFPHRTEPFNLSIDAGWTDPEGDAEAIAWARGTWDALAPFAAGGVYINFSGLDDEADAVRAAVFGRSRDRLAQIRSTWDPLGLFEEASRRP